MQQAIDLFQEKNPHITVNGSFAAQGYWDSRLIEAASNNLPDVMLFDYTQVSTFAGKDVLLDLAEIDLSTVDSSLATSGTVDGVRFGVPLGSNVQAMMVNPALFEQAGVEPPATGDTWEDFSTTLTDLRAADVYGALDWTSWFPGFEMWLRQQGQTLFTEEGELGFDEADLTEYWSQTTALRADDVLAPLSFWDQAAPAQPFSAALTATNFNWDTTFVQFVNEKVPAVDLVAPPKQGDGESGLYRKPSLLLASGANTEHPEAAIAFIDFLVNDPEIAPIFGVSLGVPAAEQVREAVIWEGNDLLLQEYEASVEDLLGDTPAPPPAGYATLDAQFTTIEADIQHGVTSLEDGVKLWFSEAELALESN